MTYKFEYADESLKLRLSDQDTFWDPELEQELQPVLRQLKEFGQPKEAGADHGFMPGVAEPAYELRRRTFNLIYVVSSKLKVVRFYDFKQVSHSIDWKTALDDMNDISEEYSIPQIGDPRKFIRSIDFIHQGITSPCDLGKAMESKAKKDKDIARRGYYYSDFLEELGLLETVKISSKVSCSYKLTVKGEFIAKSSDIDTKSRLFAEALLGFYPIQRIIEATTKDDKQLTPELIGEIIRQTTKDSCGGKTNPRRAGSLRALMNWVSRMAAIPVCRKGQEGVQLYIPHIYAN